MKNRSTILLPSPIPMPPQEEKVCCVFFQTAFYTFTIPCINFKKIYFQKWDYKIYYGIYV